MRGLKDTIKNPAAAVDLALQRDDLGQRDVELARLRSAIDENIVTGEVRVDGLGAIDDAEYARHFTNLSECRLQCHTRRSCLIEACRRREIRLDVPGFPVRS